MLSRRAIVLAALVMLLPAYAGCLSGGEAPTAADEEGPAVNDTTPDATLPDDRGTAIAFEETNQTEDGEGGIEHKHDYWGGAETIIVFQEDVGLFPIPLFPDGSSSPASVAYVKLGNIPGTDEPAKVFEGTAEVEVLVDAPTLEGATPTPLPAGLSLKYRTASSSEFVDGGSIPYGEPVLIPVGAKETDMPHSVSSLWAFQFTTDRVDFSGITVTITIRKGANVVDWPGHPEFYPDNKTERVVLDGDFAVHRSGIEEGLFYGTASSWIHPEKLISHGTGYVDVFVNISSAAASNGASPTGFFLEYHDATILDAEDAYNDRIDDEEGGRAFEDAYYHFVVPVTPEGMDGPYQPESLWGFRMVATFAETPAASLCPGCFPYDVAFTMKIVAHKADDVAPLM